MLHHIIIVDFSGKIGFLFGDITWRLRKIKEVLTPGFEPLWTHNETPQVTMDPIRILHPKLNPLRKYPIQEF